MWIATHPSHGTGPVGWRPLNSSTVLPEKRQYWALHELDPTTLQPLATTFMPAVPNHLAVDGDGTVWVTSDGIRRCPASGGLAEPFQLADLVDHLTG